MERQGHSHCTEKERKIRTERLANEVSMAKYGKRIDEIPSRQRDAVHKVGKEYTDKALNKFLRGE